MTITVLPQGPVPIIENSFAFEATFDQPFASGDTVSAQVGCSYGDPNPLEDNAPSISVFLGGVDRIVG